MAGTSFIGAGAYFLADKVPIIAMTLIKTVAHQTVAILNFLGFSMAVGGEHYVGNELFYRINYDNIYLNVVDTSLPGYNNTVVGIILACTAFQSIMIFVGGIMAVDADKRRKLKALLLIVPIIWVANLARNVGVIVMHHEWGWSFHVAHNVIGKGGSLIALFAMAYLMFKIVPELLDNIISLIDLLDRKKPNPSSASASNSTEGGGGSAGSGSMDGDICSAADMDEDTGTVARMADGVENADGAQEAEKEAKVSDLDKAQ